MKIHNLLAYETLVRFTVNYKIEEHIKLLKVINNIHMTLKVVFAFDQPMIEISRKCFDNG